MGSAKDFQNEVRFRPVTVRRNGNGRIVSKDRDPVGMRIPIDVVVVTLDPSDGRFNVRDANGGDGTVRDALGNRGAECVECGWIHWI